MEIATLLLRQCMKLNDGIRKVRFGEFLCLATTVKDYSETVN